MSEIAVQLNGERIDLPAGTTLLELLRRQGIDPGRVALAVDGTIVPREKWAQFRLKPGAEVEVVTVMAGGLAPDPLEIAGVTLTSRLFVGTGKYDSPEIMRAALEASGAEVVTVSVRYFDPKAPDGGSILAHLDPARYRILPNTAGATTAEQAVRMAELGREVTGTNWVKLEVIGEPVTLWPDVQETIKATRILVREGFVVLPYTSTDLVAALQLEDAGAATVMPLAAPIGSGQGLQDWAGLRRIVERVRVPVVCDAGLGAPSDAAQAMELGVDAVLINTAIARARDPVAMATAMRHAVIAGRIGYLAGRIPKQEASPSSPTAGVVRGPAAR